MATGTDVIFYLFYLIVKKMFKSLSKKRITVNFSINKNISPITHGILVFIENIANNFYLLIFFFVLIG
jgi:hypothetical protein